MLWRLSIIGAILLPAFFVAGANANAAPAARVMSRVSLPGTNDWCVPQTLDQTQLCLRDPSNGGTGTAVLESSPSASNAEDWNVISDSGRCPNSVVTLACPGGWVSSNLLGDTIVVLQNAGQGSLCLRTAATQFKAVMGACDENPNPEISSAFALSPISIPQCSRAFAFDSIDASNTLSNFEFLASGPSNNSQVFDSSSGSESSEWCEFSS
jgi:hypothetical protein